MITAVTTFASSIQNLLLDYSISKDGDWHIKFDLNKLEDLEDIKKDNSIKEIGLAKDGGYAPLSDVSIVRDASKILGNIPTNEYKPYLHILELDDQATKQLPIHLTQGRLPENANEVLVSNHILYNGGVEYKLGDCLDLEVGSRTIDGFILNQTNPFHHEDEGESEVFQKKTSRTFVVVGFYERFPYAIEGFSAPGYSILTKLENPDLSENSHEPKTSTLYVKLKKPSKVYDLEIDYLKKYSISNFNYNQTVLLYEGVSAISGFNIVLYGLSGIIILLIMIGSISLILNSFSISISERRKQFGLLSSVGATKKQLMNSVLFEAFFIGLIGIPLGIISGIVGIGITLYLLKDNFSLFFSTSPSVELSLHVSVPSIIAAIVLSLITILLSAYAPARRSKKASTLDALRQTTDIKLSSKNVKTSKLTRKIFGIEGDLALKNLKRNKKRYRSTVFSLFISVLLFISASSVSMYLSDTVKSAFQTVNYDLQYYAYSEEYLSDEDRKTYNDIMSLDSIKDGSISRVLYGKTFLSKNQVDSDFYTKALDRTLTNEDFSDDRGDIEIRIQICSIDHDSFVKYTEKLSLDGEKFKNQDQLNAIVIDNQHYFDVDEERYIKSNIFKDQSEKTIVLQKQVYKEGLDVDENNPYLEDFTLELPVRLTAFADTSPLGVSEFSYEDSIIIILDDQVTQDYISENTQYKLSDFYQNSSYSMYFTSKNPKNSIDEMEKIFKETNLNKVRIYNAHEEAESIRNVITVINVFAYGFIILMSLVTIANVFNTISTNINLRRREFAMLKSVGMTSAAFNKMLNFECIFYGLKALLYGLPASLLLTYLIFQIFQHGVHTSFYLPTKSIIISIFSVFMVVFVSMMYSMRKIRKENILDALKNGNL